MEDGGVPTRKKLEGGSRERLLAAAKSLMASEGYEGTTTAAIARYAGTSESQLVRYFGNKPGLLNAVFDTAWTSLNSRINESINSADTGHDALLAILSLFLIALQADPELATLMVFEGRRLRSNVQGVSLSSGYMSFEEKLMDLIRSCQDEGSIAPSLKAPAIFAALLGMAEGMLRDRLILRRTGHRAAYDQDDIRLVFAAMLDGLRPNAKRT